MPGSVKFFFALYIALRGCFRHCLLNPKLPLPSSPTGAPFFMNDSAEAVPAALASMVKKHTNFLANCVSISTLDRTKTRTFRPVTVTSESHTS